MSDAEYTIAAGLLGASLGADPGRRVHAGVVERGSVEGIRAVLCYADIRGFTAIADTTPGSALVDMLDDTSEALTAALRRRGGQVLKFLGDSTLLTRLRGGRQANCFAPDFDPATVVREKTGENAYQGRFAGAVLSNNRMNFRWQEIKIYKVDSAPAHHGSALRGENLVAAEYCGVHVASSPYLGMLCKSTPFCSAALHRRSSPPHDP